MKIQSKQIIIVIVAFLVGIGATLLFTREKDAQNHAEDTTIQESATETKKTDDTEATNETAPVTATSGSTVNKTTTTATSKPSTEFVTGKCSTGLSGRKDTKLNAIVLNWSPCASEDFQFYKLVKSSKNSNPSYPGDGIAFSSSNKNAASFVDKTVAQRTTYYYRMCVVQRLNTVNCSNVASVSF